MSRPNLPHVPLWCGAAYRLVEVGTGTVMPVRLLRASQLSYPRIHVFEHLDISYPIEELEVVEMQAGEFYYMNNEMQLELA